MCALLFDVFKHWEIEKTWENLLLRKTDVLKLLEKVDFSERKFEEMH